MTLIRLPHVTHLTATLGSTTVSGLQTEKVIPLQATDQKPAILQTLEQKSVQSVQ